MEIRYSANHNKNYSMFEKDSAVIRILLVGSQPLVLIGIDTMLRRNYDIEILGLANNKIEMLLRINETNPDLVVISENEALPESNYSLDMINTALSEFPYLNILFIIHKCHESKELSALKIGVKGIIFADTDTKTLRNCIKTILSNGFWIRRQILDTF